VGIARSESHRSVPAAAADTAPKLPCRDAAQLDERGRRHADMEQREVVTARFRFAESCNRLIPQHPTSP
jgi:hypothetical protein